MMLFLCGDDCNDDPFTIENRERGSLRVKSVMAFKVREFPLKLIFIVKFYYSFFDESSTYDGRGFYIMVEHIYFNFKYCLKIIM